MITKCLFLRIEPHLHSIAIALTALVIGFLLGVLLIHPRYHHLSDQEIVRRYCNVLTRQANEGRAIEVWVVYGRDGSAFYRSRFVEKEGE